ncbi:MAG: NADP-dependent malic enzyme [Rhodospirillales bacterium]|nr:NADP-dependent malic enzyme [Rhodospirillales bacterium]
MTNGSKESFDREALLMHASGRPGKIEITATKPMNTQRDLALAYSPGVAAPCLKIYDDPDTAYDYTAKGNLVAVISNGTAVLGLGNLGAVASKPVMEGKAVLFKRFADIDGIDLEVETEEVEEFINCVKYLGASFGGINLEDIKAPECFIIEQRLREIMEIPVFHDDQHGTAIIAAAGLINALDLTGRDIKDVKLVLNGAGAASIACAELVKSLGIQGKNVIMCDSKGVIHKGRDDLNQWKSAHAVETEDRTLADAMKGADAFFGLSVKDAVDQDMVLSMNKQPIIFAMANPDPEISPEDVLQVSPDAIVATGRSDYPNQVNNVLGFPYIFRGALDVRASSINEDMKAAAARAIAALAREDVPDEVSAAYGKTLQYGPEYIIPAPFDPRLISRIPIAVAQAAMDSGVARSPIVDMDDYRAELSARLDPTVASLSAILEHVKRHPQRVVFCEGEEEKSIRAALAYRNAGLGEPVLIGRESRIHETMTKLGLSPEENIEIINAKISEDRERYTNFIYERLQRKGILYRDAQRMVNQERNIWGASMVAHGDADAMVTGLTRNYYSSLEEIESVLDAREGHDIFGLTMLLNRGKTLFVSDTVIHELPTPEQLAKTAIETAAVAKHMGHEPRVAMISFSNFGNPDLERSSVIKDAVDVLDTMDVDFEYDGEMGVETALNPKLMQAFPFCRLTGPANILIMPGLHSAHISTNLLRELGGSTTIGPILIGLEKSAQIVPKSATVTDIVNIAAIAAYNAVPQGV